MYRVNRGDSSFVRTSSVDRCWSGSGVNCRLSFFRPEKKKCRRLTIIKEISNISSFSISSFDRKRILLKKEKKKRSPIPIGKTCRDPERVCQGRHFVDTKRNRSTACAFYAARSDDIFEDPERMVGPRNKRKKRRYIHIYIYRRRRKEGVNAAKKGTPWRFEIELR